jgi:PrgI family protein
MRYIVPQFIDSEDKIFGPITVRQFLICTIGGLAIFLSFKLADFSLFILETFIIGGLTVVTAFVKVNGKKFHNFLLDLLNFSFKTQKLSVWQKKETVFVKKKIEKEKKEDSYVFEAKDLPRTKLSEISLIVDTGGAYIGENQEIDKL